ncbi:MAG: PorV/PorQ family protein [Candidatus Kapabacteria bacterium]|nr:PorV/PorQ family protein [Candidatus Kapabacteria bacterium]
MKTTAMHTLRALVLILVAAGSSSIASAQPIAVTAGEFTKVGLAGGQFLKIGVGARGTGMAGAFSGLANDLTSLYWNPAGAADIKNYAADAHTTFWFAGMQHSFAAAIMPVSEKLRAAVSFTSFNSGDIQITTMDQQDGTGGIYSVSDIALGFSLSGYLTEQFAFGVTAKYVQHAFSQMSAGGFVFDIGTRYNTGFNGMTLGFTITGLGTEQTFTGPEVNRTNAPFSGINTTPLDMTLATSSFNLPLSFRAGLGVDLFKGFLDVAPPTDTDGTIIHNWLVGLDFETLSDVPEQFAIGTEYTFREFVTVRAGYRFGHDQFGLAAGLGLRYTSGDFDGSVDYSINPSANLGLVNRISLSMRFN